MSSPAEEVGDGRPAARFATTRWTVVRAAASTDPETVRAALEELCESYWFPLYAFARGQGHSSGDSEDLTQGFFAGLLDGQSIDGADPERGRFRAYLLGAFRHHLSHQRDQDRALKRGGGARVVSLDAGLAEQRWRTELSHADSPERAFERAWAETLLARCRERLQDEYEGQRKGNVFQLLRSFLGTGSQTRPYREVAEELGLSEVAVKVAVHRLRKRYRELLRSEVAQTLVEGEDPDAEIGELLEALGGKSR